jgi:tryptophanyl-tRNA synthetase
METLGSPEVYDHFLQEYNRGTIRYGDMKKQLAEDIIVFTSPLRERILELSANDQYLTKVAKMGADKASESARKTINEVRQIIGFKSFH